MSEKHLKKGDENPPVRKDVLRLYSMMFCPYAERLYLILAAKGINYEVVNCNMVDKPEFLLERYPTGRIPVLEYQGHIVPDPDALIITDLIEDLFPEKPLAAKDPYQKAADRVVVAKFDQVKAKFYAVNRNKGNIDIENELKTALIGFQEELRARKTPFFGGEECGLVDYMIWPWMYRFATMHAPVFDAAVDLKAWAERMNAVPAVKACPAPASDMIEFYKGWFVANTADLYK